MYFLQMNALRIYLFPQVYCYDGCVGSVKLLFRINSNPNCQSIRVFICFLGNVRQEFGTAKSFFNLLSREKRSTKNTINLSTLTSRNSIIYTLCFCLVAILFERAKLRLFLKKRFETYIFISM